MPELPFADAKIHSEIATQRLMQGLNVERLVPNGVWFQVNVIGGSLDGLGCVKYASNCVVGHGLDCDIVFFDDNISENHFRLDLKSSVFGPLISVKALGEDVYVDGALLAAGVSSKFRGLPLVVSTHGVELKLEERDSESKTPHSYIKRAATLARYPALSVLLLILLVQLLDYSNFNFDLALGGNQLPYDVVQRNEMNNVLFETASLSVETKLNELGLDRYITTSFDGGGAIELSGTLRSKNRDAWMEFQRWYDQSEVYVLNSEVRIAPDLESIPAIASVKLSLPKALMLHDNTKVELGEAVIGDLILKDIQSDHLVLSGRGDDIYVSFDGQEVPHG